MALYAIGDIQGCYSSLRRLLDAVQFDPGSDVLWFVGDLVNRGPESLGTVRFVKSLEGAAVTVLGNHDLHLLSAAFVPGRRRDRDTFHDILDAPDCDELLAWLRTRPLLHRDENYVLVHAGLPAEWDAEFAAQCAEEVSEVLAGDGCSEFLTRMYGDEPRMWSAELRGWDRLRFITNALTRMRYCSTDGAIDLSYKGSPGTQPDGLLPWFEVPNRRATNVDIVFGHWSMLGFMARPGLYGLDTGCLWGGHLTALRLDLPENERRPISVPCPACGEPGSD